MSSMSFFVSSPIPAEKQQLRDAWTELDEIHEHYPNYVSEKRKTSLGRTARYVNYIKFPYAKTALCLRVDDFYTKHAYGFTDLTYEAVKSEFLPFLEKHQEMKGLTIESLRKDTDHEKLLVYKEKIEQFNVSCDFLDRHKILTESNISKLNLKWRKC